LDGLAAKARAAGLNEISVTVARGVPDELVAAYAASGRYTMLILAPGCHDTIDQAFGSVTSAVMRRARVPMLLAPPLCDVPG
jgi:nucleotide-binding universal stress UspA family protein